MADIAVGGTLGDFAGLQRGTTYQGKLLGSPGPWLLGLACIARNGGFKGDNLKTYGGPSEEKVLVYPGDLIVSLKDVTQAADLLGSVVRVPSWIEKGRLTQDTVKLVFANGFAAQNYIYWLLRTPQARSHCRRHATGTTNLGLAREDFLSLEVPPLDAERRHLLQVLQALEDHIELNRLMNATLEALARAFFQDWFVDFGPTRAKMDGREAYLAPELWSLFSDRFDSEGIPEGWHRGSLQEIASSPPRTVSPQSVTPATPYIALEHMPRESIALGEWARAEKATTTKSEFKKGEFLFGKLRPYFHKVGIAPVDGICSTDIVVVAPRQQHWSAMVLACISSHDFVQHSNVSSTGTKMPRTSWSIMRSYELALPPPQVAKTFEALCHPMIERIIVNVHESRTLAALRDLLLPKLMSGEISVGSAKRDAVP